MELNRLKKTIAILLAVLFLVTVTVGAVSADKDYKLKRDAEALKNDKGTGLKVVSISKELKVVRSEIPDNTALAHKKYY
jgi:hypothetical protein